MTKSTSTTNKPIVATPPLRHAALSDLRHGLDNGLLTASHLVQAYLKRMHEVKHEFNAITQVNPHALSDAHTLDLQHHSNAPLGGPLHRIPILLKDNIPTLDDTDTTCGSLALVGTKPAQEAAVVTALRSAGAVILGKASMAEWSGFRSTSGCSGWSARGGQTRGVFYPGMKASGSSSGSAVAVALGLCCAAIGTETCYSVVSPAERSGVVGFKPTRGPISSEGIIHASKRLDTVGLLTRGVNDAMQITRELMCQSSHHSSDMKVKLLQGIGHMCSKSDLTGMCIGIPWHLNDLNSLHGAKVESFKKVLGALKQAGATFVHDVHVTGAEEYEALSVVEKQIILDTDMKIAINEYLASLTTNPQNIQNLRDLVDFIKSCPAEEYPQRNVEGFERAQATDPSSVLYLRMLGRDEHFAGEGGIQGALNRHRCDILLVPTLSVILQTFAAKAGSPVLSVPMGIYPEGTPVEINAKNGLVKVAPNIPFSAYIFGRVSKDEDVLKVGYSVEQSMEIGELLKPYLEPKTEIACVRDTSRGMEES